MANWLLLIVVTTGFLAISSDAVKVVYTRAYAGKDLGVARSYHAQYFDIVRRSFYTVKNWYTYFKCGNFEANMQGDYMGFFHCDQYFEPSNFDYCCGIKGAHYCCPNASLSNPYLSDPDPDPTSSPGTTTYTYYALSGWIIAVIVVSVLIFVLPLIGACIYCCVAACCLSQASKTRSTVQATPNATTVTVQSGGYPVQQTPGGYPVQQTPGAYPQQQTVSTIPMSNYSFNYNPPSAYGQGAAQGQPPPSYSSVVQET